MIGNWVIEKVDYNIKINSPYTENYIRNSNERYLGNRLMFMEMGKFEEPDDKYDELHSEGEWGLNNRTVRIKYLGGGGIEYWVMDVNDSTLTLVDEELVFHLRKFPFTRPKNDTIFNNVLSEERVFQLITIEDFETDMDLMSVKDSSSTFVWIQCDYLSNYDLKHYNLKIRGKENCKLYKTARNNLWEIVVLKKNNSDSISLDISFHYETDSIIIKKKYDRETFQYSSYPEHQTIKFKIE